MPKIKYIDKRFSEEQQQIIDLSNRIIADYARQGFSLTLRQLYYQFVSRDALPKRWADPDTGSTNNLKSYGKLGDIISDARLAGLIDWNAIEDRTRNLRGLAHWDTPASIIESVSHQFRVDLWADQPVYVEVWVEKDALVGVLETICNRWDVPYFSCRGYTSQSEMWGAAQRLIAHAENNGQRNVIIHLGDHDPSGKDMTRDVMDRLAMFVEHEGHIAPSVHRIALNMDQVDKYEPPPNPAKVTDSRAGKYIAEFGKESWELDALEPTVIANLIEEEIKLQIEDDEKFEARQLEVSEGRKLLAKASKHWIEIVKMLDKKKEK